jgi:cytochrome c oxidase subunit 2
MTDWFAKHVLGLPTVASAKGVAVDNLMVYVHWLMLALFVGWSAYFFYALWRFNQRRHAVADHEGSKSKIPKYTEIAVVLAEAVLLIGVAIPIWAKSVSQFPDPKDATLVQIVAQQYAWNVRYPGPDGVFGRQDMTLVSDTNVFGMDPSDPNGKDDIQLLNDIHVPVNKPVLIYLSSKDVIHSLKLVAMRITQDAIPGLRIPVTFTPTKIGRYQIECAQLCGPGHAAMSGGFVTVESEADYKAWLASKEGKPVSSSSFE